MATGSITTLGLGSGLELQNILDQLKEADKASINAKETQKIELQGKIDAYNSLNAKLFNVKSDALSLSLESDFLKTSVSVSDEEIVSATADDGIEAKSFNLDIEKKARFNSWQTVGVASKTNVIYTEPQSGISDIDAEIATGTETMDILYGAAESQQSISVTLSSGQTLTQIAETINDAASNKDAEGTQLVRATVESNEGEYYIRLSAVAGGDAVDEQVSLTGFDYIKSDTTFKIKRADEEDPMFISLAPGATYADTVNLINTAADNPGVTAAIIDTGDAENPYRLTLTSDATGEEHRITIEGLPMTEVTGAEGDSLNAEFTINGISYQRQSNDGLTDVIPGVTLNLKKIGETSIGVTKNTDEIKDNILSLVENFNDLVSLIQGDTTQTEDDTEEDKNPFEGDYTASSMSYQLRNLFTTKVNVASPYKSLADIGLEVNRDGTLTIDEDKLDQAMGSNPEGIATLFIGDAEAGITGLGDVLNNGITDMVSTSGVVTTEIDEAETKMLRLNEEIETATTQLDKRYETMADSFVRLDSYIRQLNAESAYMESMIESFNKTTE